MSKKAKFRMRLTPWQEGERMKCSAMHRHVCLRFYTLLAMEINSSKEG